MRCYRFPSNDKTRWWDSKSRRVLLSLRDEFVSWFVDVTLTRSIDRTNGWYDLVAIIYPAMDHRLESDKVTPRDHLADHTMRGHNNHTSFLIEDILFRPKIPVQVRNLLLYLDKYLHVTILFSYHFLFTIIWIRNIIISCAFNWCHVKNLA